MGTDRGALTSNPPDLLRGTLDLLILRTLANGPLHGYAIAQRLRVASEDMLQVGESALYPCLQRLLTRGWVKGAWGTSENNRRARYYRLTPAGRRQLSEQTNRWDAIVRAVNRVLRPA